RLKKVVQRQNVVWKFWKLKTQLQADKMLLEKLILPIVSLLKILLFHMKTNLCSKIFLSMSQKEKRWLWSGSQAVERVQLRIYYPVFMMCKTEVSKLTELMLRISTYKV